MDNFLNTGIHEMLESLLSRAQTTDDQIRALQKDVVLIFRRVDRLEAGNNETENPVDLRTMAPGQKARPRATCSDAYFIGYDLYSCLFVFRLPENNEYFACDISGKSATTPDYDIVEILPLEGEL